MQFIEYNSSLPHAVLYMNSLWQMPNHAYRTSPQTTLYLAEIPTPMLLDDSLAGYDDNLEIRHRIFPEPPATRAIQQQRRSGTIPQADAASNNATSATMSHVALLAE